jgi:hypothetical protein
VYEGPSSFCMNPLFQLTLFSRSSGIFIKIHTSIISTVYCVFFFIRLHIPFQFPYNAIGRSIPGWVLCLRKRLMTTCMPLVIVLVFVLILGCFAVFHFCSRVFPFSLMYLFVFFFFNSLYQVLWGVSFGVVNFLIKCFFC